MDYAAGKRKLARPPFSNPLIGQFARYKPAPRTLIVKRGFLTIRQPPLLFWPRTARVCSRRRHWHSAHCPFHPRRTHRSLYPLAGTAGKRPTGQYAPRKYPYCPSHAHYQRRDKELFFRDVARRTDGLISATTLHLVWSTGMALLLPVAIR